MTSITFAAVICDDDEPCSVNTALEPESSFTMSPRSTTRPLYFWCFASNSAFFKWQMSITEAKSTVLPSFSASLMTFCSLLWSLAMLAVCSASPTLCPLLHSHPFFFSLFDAWALTCAQDCDDPINWIPFLQCDLHDLLADLSKRFLVVSWACTMHACFDLRVLGLFSPWASPCPSFRTLQGVAASMGNSKVVRAFFSWFPWTPRLYVELLSTFLTKSLARNDRVLMLLEFLSAVPWTTCIRLEVFPIRYRELRETGPCFRWIPVTINVQIIINTAFQQHIQCRVRPPDKKSQWCWESFFRHMELNSWFIVTTMNVIPCDRPNIVSGFTAIRQRV